MGETTEMAPICGCAGKGFEFCGCPHDAVAVMDVSSIPDAELLRRVVRSIVRRRPRRKELAWAAVSEAFSLGSTFSMQLCRRFGLDPDTGEDQRVTPA